MLKILKKQKKELIKILRQNLIFAVDSIRYVVEDDVFKFYVRNYKKNFFIINYKALDSENSKFDFSLDGINSKTPINIIIEKKLKECGCNYYIKSKNKEFSLLDLYNYLYENYPVLDLDLDENILYVDKKHQIFKNKNSEFVLVSEGNSFYDTVPAFDVYAGFLAMLLDVKQIAWNFMPSESIINFFNKCSSSYIDENTTILKTLNDTSFCNVEDFYSSMMNELNNTDMGKIYNFCEYGDFNFYYKNYKLDINLIVPEHLFEKYKDVNFGNMDSSLLNEIHIQFVLSNKNWRYNPEIGIVKFSDFKEYDSFLILDTVLDKATEILRRVAELKE